MAGSFRKLRILMVYENKRADLFSVQYASQRITWSALICRAPNVTGPLQRAPSLFRIAVMRMIIRPQKSLRDDAGRVLGRMTSHPEVIALQQSILAVASRTIFIGRIVAFAESGGEPPNRRDRR